MEEQEKKQLVADCLGGLVHQLLYDNEEVAEARESAGITELALEDSEVLSVEEDEFGDIPFRARILLAGQGARIEVVVSGTVIDINEDGSKKEWDISAEYDVESCEVLQA